MTPDEVKDVWRLRFALEKYHVFAQDVARMRMMQRDSVTPEQVRLTKQVEASIDAMLATLLAGPTEGGAA